MSQSEQMISEVVEIHGGYAEFVNLPADLFDDTNNVERMERYRPIASHRAAFQTLARSLNAKDKRCYLLTGPYGSGKSHLCLMFANYLQTPAGEPPMPRFFEHFSKVAPHVAEELKAKRQNRRYLVALCEWGNKDGFEEVVLRAVEQALYREGLHDKLETLYKQALEKIEQWRDLSNNAGSNSNFYKAFEQQVKERNPGQTVSQFIKRLDVFDYEALDEFKTIHYQITTARFTSDYSNLVPILKHTLSSDAFRDRYLGILVLFDEFGEALESSRFTPRPSRPSPRWLPTLPAIAPASSSSEPPTRAFPTMPRPTTQPSSVPLVTASKRCL